VIAKDEILYFMHIPKTGGTTLISLLDNNFSYDELLDVRDWRILVKKMPIDFSKYRLVRGHFGYGFYHLLPKKPLFLTMLREPVQHVISIYKHLQRPENGPETAEYFRTHTLEEALDHPTLHHRLLNIQTRIVGIDRDELAFRTTEEKRTGAEIYDNLPERQLLRIAKKRLNEFAFIGIVEKYDESLALLSYKFEWTPIPTATRKNVDKTEKPVLNNKIIEKIRKVTKLDRELYEHGKVIFERRYQAMVKALKEEYYAAELDGLTERQAVHKMLQEWYSDTYAHKNRLRASLHYDFGQVLNGWGWEKRTKNPKSGIIKRWTGPETSSVIDLPLRQDKDLHLRIKLGGYMSKEILDSLEMRVNNQTQPVPLQTVNEKGKGVIMQCMIPKDQLGWDMSFTRLTFEVKETIAPKLADPDVIDKRLLGLLFARIIVSPEPFRVES